MNSTHSKILDAVIGDLIGNQRDALRAAYDEIVRTYFAPPAHAEMMRVRELGNDAIRDAARRLY